MNCLMIMLQIDLSNPTIVGGLFGVFGSVLGAVAGALLTALFTWINTKGKIKCMSVHSHITFQLEDKFGTEVFLEENEVNENAIKGFCVDTKILITNSKNKNFSLSSLKLLIKNKKYNFKEQYQLKDLSDPKGSNLIYYGDANNYIMPSNSNMLLRLRFYGKNSEIINFYKHSKFYFCYIDNKGKLKRKKIKMNFITDVYE